MDTFVCRSSTFIAFISVAFLLSSTNGLQINEQQLCQNPSELWKGACFYSNHCKTQCMEKEGALFGNCDRFVCYCTYDCKNVCKKPSGIWKGPCFRNAHCSRQCREKENSLRGDCLGNKCICYYNC